MMPIFATFSNMDGTNGLSIGPGAVLRDGRYEIRARVDRRGDVEWFAGVQHVNAAELPIRIGIEPISPSPRPWPSLEWEQNVRSRALHLGLPRIIDQFHAEGFSILILEDPSGISLWDAWDDPNVGRKEQIGWLLQLADLIRAVHRSAALLESLRPDQVRISPLGALVFSPNVVLIPLPPPDGSPVRPQLFSAPELIQGGSVDARADLYHFGSVLYSLQLGRELAELDFDETGRLKPPLELDPDLHPCLGRVLARTLSFERGHRFPSDDARDDLSGFGELVRTLESAQAILSRARLDIAAWTTTGMVRGNNEDAVAIFHGSEQRESLSHDWAFIALADGLGGNAAGEVAAALTIQTLSRGMTQSSPPFTPTELTEGRSESVATRILQSLRDANQSVYLAGRSDNQHGMGCTAEAVFVDGERAIVGHVGDSRTYRLSRGVLELLTRDQTFLADMLEQRKVTVEEMRSHPRRGELTQAIGGRPVIDPEIVRARFVPGDWLVVCSDGLTARVPDEQIAAILENASSAESAARRLINRANAAGAADNVTVAVVRGC